MRPFDASVIERSSAVRDPIIMTMETERASRSGPVREAFPPPSLSPDDAGRLSRYRETCLRSLARRYCAIFFVLAVPAFVLTVASEGEALPVVAPAFIVVTGVLAALVTERSEPGKRLRELDRYLKGEAPAPAVPQERPARETPPEAAAAGYADVAPRSRAAASEPGDAVAAPPPFLLRAFYFLVIGWWLSAVWIHLAWLLSFLVVGISAGRAMFEQLPVVLSLSPVRVPSTPAPMRARVPFPIAALYFLGIGSWLSLLVAEFGWLLSILPLPRRVGLSCLRAVPYVLTLRAR